MQVTTCLRPKHDKGMVLFVRTPVQKNGMQLKATVWFPFVSTARDWQETINPKSATLQCDTLQFATLQCDTLQCDTLKSATLQCDTRAVKSFSKQAYKNGVVLVSGAVLMIGVMRLQLPRQGDTYQKANLVD